MQKGYTVLYMFEESLRNPSRYRKNLLYGAISTLQEDVLAAPRALRPIMNEACDPIPDIQNGGAAESCRNSLLRQGMQSKCSPAPSHLITERSCHSSTLLTKQARCMQGGGTLLSSNHTVHAKESFAASSQPSLGNI
eukprot:scaffold1_cov375-Pavlova_lutheri.AAC.20